MPDDDDDRHQSEYVALKSVVLDGTVCIYITDRTQRGGHHYIKGNGF